METVSKNGFAFTCDYPEPTGMQAAYSLAPVQECGISTSETTKNSPDIIDADGCTQPCVKQKRRRKETEQTFRSEALKFPPCCVCGGKASGFHFGVNTCEACKNFFRRYLTQGKTFKCKADNDCNLLEKGRSVCPSCRLEKCLQLGMAREKSKMGRLSATRRTEIINKVKQTPITNDKVVSFNPASYRDKSTRSATSDEDQSTRSAISDEDQSTRSATSDEDQSTRNDINLECEIITKMLSKQSIQDPGDMFSGDMIASLIEAKTEMIKLSIGEGVETDEQIKELARECLHNYQLKQQIFGEMKPVPNETYNMLYKEYGIDIDGRMEYMKYEMNDLDTNIAGFCNFAVRIPGFLRLSIADQSNLMKANLAALNPFFFYRFYCPESQVFLGKHKSYYIDEMRSQFYSDEFLNHLFEILIILQNLRFNDTDLVLLSAVALMQPTTCSLQNGEAVEKIQESLMTLLWQEVKRSYGKDSYKRMAQLMDLLFRALENSEFQRQEYKQLSEKSVFFEEYPVLKDFISP